MAMGPQTDDGIVGINVTPLVDIMLVLLIIFMVAGSYLVNPAIEVDLPQAASGGETVETTLAVTLERDGTLHLDGARIGEDALAERCRALSAANPQVQAIIAADGRASHAQVVRLIDLVKLNGVRRFALNIERKVEG